MVNTKQGIVKQSSRVFEFVSIIDSFQKFYF